MNNHRLNQDLKLLIALYDNTKRGQKNVRWNKSKIEIDHVPMPRHIVPLRDQERRTCSLSIPIPVNLYDPAGNGQYHYYNNIMVEKGLRWRRDGRLVDIPRMTRYEKQGERFTWVCLHLNLCGPNTNIETLIREFQRFLASPT